MDKNTPQIAAAHSAHRTVGARFAFLPRRPKNPHKKGSAMHDLLETKQDIKDSKRGLETEASMEEMQAAKRRLRQQIREANREELAAKATNSRA